MTWLRTMLVLTLAVLWLPVSMHCELEQIPALHFLSCCPDETAPSHQDEDCQTDGCAVVESGLYKTEERQVSLPSPDLLLTDIPGWQVEVLIPATPFSFAPFQQALVPLELPVLWQFLQRTAPSPRAPSFVS